MDHQPSGGDGWFTLRLWCWPASSATRWRIFQARHYIEGPDDSALAVMIGWSTPDFSIVGHDDTFLCAGHSAVRRPSQLAETLAERQAGAPAPDFMDRVARVGRVRLAVKSRRGSING